MKQANDANTFINLFIVHFLLECSVGSQQCTYCVSQRPRVNKTCYMFGGGLSGPDSPPPDQ